MRADKYQFLHILNIIMLMNYQHLEQTLNYLFMLVIIIWFNFMGILLLLLLLCIMQEVYKSGINWADKLEVK